MTTRFDHVTGRYRVAIHITSDIPGDDGITVISGYEFTSEQDAEAAERVACDAANAGLTLQPRQALFDFLAHGDETHRRWLKDAIDAFYEGRPRPPVKGLNFEPVMTNERSKGTAASGRDLSSGERLPLPDASTPAST